MVFCAHTIQVLLPPYLPSSTQLSQCTTTATAVSGSVSGSVSEGIAVPPAVRALAFVTLGKLCLRDAALAKRSVTVLVSNFNYLNICSYIHNF
jgi:hypothetical protein